MITWTESARNELECHVAAVRTRMIAAGADADEVAADLERHVEAELTEGKIGVATQEDVRRVLMRMGSMEFVEPAEARGTKSSRDVGETADGFARRRNAKGGPRFHWLPTGLGWFFGVLLPLATVIFELATGLCAAELFDPVPTIFHVVAILLVPVSNGLVLLHCARNRLPAPAWLNAVNAASIAVAAVYSVLLAVITPFAVIGIIAFGLGLLPLAPVCSLMTAGMCRSRLRRLSGCEAGARLPQWRRGLALGFAGMTMLMLPLVLTWIGVAMARSVDVVTVERGLTVLRWSGGDELLLRVSRGEQAANRGAGSWFRLLTSGHQLTQAEARKLYFRVTGQPISRPKPHAWFRFGRRGVNFSENLWDADRGTAAVGQRLAKLSLAESRMDGLVDAASNTSYTEWTMVFSNAARGSQEARALIVLPAGGAVSRLTLWINGEEREAAFAGRAQVSQAYQKVAVRMNRDPVLVTSKGADRILMQCFPVPAGGDMKIRIGITAPLVIENETRGRLVLPRLIEQNFDSAGAHHAVWLESDADLGVSESKLQSSTGASGRRLLHGEISAESGPVELRTSRAGLPLEAWTEMRRVNWAAGSVFQQRIEAAQESRRDAIAVVIDGSGEIDEHLPAFAASLSTLPDTVKISLWLAGKKLEVLDNATPGKAAEWLKSRDGVGGQDSTAALAAAWDAIATSKGEILWVHGAQPYAWHSIEALLQKEARQTGRVGIRALAVSDGANVILEKLEGLPRVSAAPRFSSVGEDFERELARAISGGDRWRVVRTRVESAAGYGVQEKSGHIARLWASDEVQRLLDSGKRADAVKLAGEFQLVTPVSGAVVLETKQQFDAAGLKAIDPTTAPTIPEPATVVLIMGGAAAVFVMWKKRRRRA